MAHSASNTRQQILQAALRRFAEQGYAGTSIQEIVDAAHVTKPCLYYHFTNKADLYRALVDWAFEERYRLQREAAARGQTLPEKLTEICTATFEFVRANRALTQLSFATAFAAKGEVPVEAGCARKAVRSFEYLHGLIRQAAEQGELSRRFATEEMAMGFAGMMNLHVMAYLIRSHGPLNRRTARRVVELFLAGAQAKPT
jgi:TetR/AcrR family transcriptional regulator